ncbi:MAG: hypothetical protein WA829_01300 [Candidatus Acidiferrum sp.]
MAKAFARLSCDNVEGFTIVIADGSVLRADAAQNSAMYADSQLYRGRS